MRTYSLDLRERVAAACDEGVFSRPEIAEQFGVCTSWIRRLLQRRRTSGSLAPLPHAGGAPPALNAVRRQRLADLVAADPDATLAELARRLRVPVSVSTLSRVLAHLGLPRKKSASPLMNATGPTSPVSAPTGVPASVRSIRSASSSSMKRARTSR